MNTAIRPDHVTRLEVLNSGNYRYFLTRLERKIDDRHLLTEMLAIRGWLTFLP